MTYATERLIKNAQIVLPGSLDNVIRLELYNVLDSFFRDSSIWQEDVTFSVTAGDPVGTIYYIEPESVSAIVRLMYVFNLDRLQQRASMQIPGEVTFLTPPPQQEPPATYQYVATVALSIIDPVQSDGYPEFPQWILDKYGLGILDGVLGRMMLQPAKPYTNEKLGVAHWGAFRKTCSIAGTEATHRNVHGAQSWMFPQQFRHIGGGSMTNAVYPKWKDAIALGTANSVLNSSGVHTGSMRCWSTPGSTPTTPRMNFIARWRAFRRPSRKLRRSP